MSDRTAEIECAFLDYIDSSDAPSFGGACAHAEETLGCFLTADEEQAALAFFTRETRK